MLTLLLSATIMLLTANANSVADYSHVVPQPASVNLNSKAKPFVLDSSTVIATVQGNADMVRNAGFLRQYIKDMTGIDVSLKKKEERIMKKMAYGNHKAQTSSTKSQSSVISLELTAKGGIPHEGYVITVSNKGVSIKGSTPAGVFYGIQTLRKSLPVSDPQTSTLNPQLSVELPAVTITDAPRFAYRGMMLDCSRHFFTADFVKQYIDLIALHNMNRFHWHLTDDQGWRLPVEKYPKLIEVGSRRRATVMGNNSEVLDGVPYGGYYTDEEIRDVVKYAADRYITIIPEVDMPGHMMAALASYPELGCTGGPYETGMYWGVYKDVLCAGNSRTYDFVKAVIDKLCSLFPGQYIHIGGDECPKVRWEKCPKCQAVITSEHLKAHDGKSSEALLQGYFTHQVQAYVSGKGKRIIGWDELLGCDVDTSATIMSWRGAGPGAEAALLGHDVIMSPTTNCYFDYYQAKEHVGEPLAIGGFIDVAKVYGFEPVASRLTQQSARHILGVQANLWAEYISNPAQVEYMVLPRMAALSEVQWMQPEAKDFNAFKERLTSFRHIYELYGLTYAHHLWQDEFRKAAKQY